MRSIALLVVMMVGCGDAAPPGADGGVGPPVDVIVPATCPPLPARDTFNFFGEACVSDAFPANTLCHGDAGWCVANVCRPQSSLRGAPSCPACPAGTEHQAPAGARYCSPG